MVGQGMVFGLLGFYRLWGFSGSKHVVSFKKREEWLQRQSRIIRASTGPKGHSPMAGLSPPQVLRVGSAPQFQRAGCQRLWQVPGTEHLDRDIFSHSLKASVVYPARFRTCFLKFAPPFFFHLPFEVERGPLCAGPSLCFGSR